MWKCIRIAGMATAHHHQQMPVRSERGAWSTHTHIAAPWELFSALHISFLRWFGVSVVDCEFGPHHSDQCGPKMQQIWNIYVRSDVDATENDIRHSTLGKMYGISIGWSETNLGSHRISHSIPCGCQVATHLGVIIFPFRMSFSYKNLATECSLCDKRLV